LSRRRSLRPEEEELWQSVARTAQPLHPQKTPLHLHGSPTAPRKIFDLPPSVAQDAPVPAAPQPFRIGEKSRTVLGHDLLPPLSDRLAVQPVHMDAKAFARMSRGKLSPEARIDLHGLTLAEAQPELIRFILNAQSQGLRLVLVITGKGRPGDDEGPIPRRPPRPPHARLPRRLRLAGWRRRWPGVPTRCWSTPRGACTPRRG